MYAWPSVSVPSLLGTPVPLQLRDTSRGDLAPVTPGDTAGLYVCGITPYDATHLGHAATYVTFDLINRILRDNGHKVHYVQNVTDVDDPLFERADRDGVDWRELGNEQTDLFRSDMEALRIIPPDHYVGATEVIDEVVEFIQKLFDNGAAYQISVDDDPEYQDVYFPVTATPQFGYESGYDAETMAHFFAERGGDPERVGKHHPLDALLWRQQRPGEPAWDSPWGAGRPGWHIECAAIALNRLGTSFDIQGGGSDLIFPHHEFSAAHVEAATGCERMARHYVHTGMIALDGVKMSKSLGNLVFVSKLRAQGVHPSAIRLGIYAGHYAANRDWSDTVLADAVTRHHRWREACEQPVGVPAADTVQKVREALSHDLDTPRALALIDVWAEETLRGLGDDVTAPATILTLLDSLLGVR